jgi:hypothetical protein
VAKGIGIGKSNLPPTKHFVNYWKGLVINYKLQVLKKGILLVVQAAGVASNG